MEKFIVKLMKCKGFVFVFRHGKNAKGEGLLKPSEYRRMVGGVGQIVILLL